MDDSRLSDDTTTTPTLLLSINAPGDGGGGTLKVRSGGSLRLSRQVKH